MLPKIEFEFDINYFFIRPRYHKCIFDNKEQWEYYGHKKVIWINWLYFTIYFIWEYES